MLFYSEAAPKPEFSHLVLSFWKFTVDGAATQPMFHEIFPDGCISLFYYQNSSFGIQKLSHNNLQLKPVKIPVFAGDVYWAVRFSPAACAKILQTNPQKLLPRNPSDETSFSFPTGNLLAELDDCQSFEEAIEVYEGFLTNLNLQPEDIDGKVLETVRIIEQYKGEIKISDIAAQVNLSSRQLERRFKNNSGVTPKQYARMRRLRATAVTLVEQDSVNWAERAAEMGFADQAHLSHEFSSLTGRSPNSFAEKVKHITHGNLIK